MIKYLTICTLTLMLMACQSNVAPTPKKTHGIFSDWYLSKTDSAFSFITTKNKVVTEEHTMQYKSGQVDNSGGFTVMIDVATVDTLIPIRDQRLKNILFKTKTYPLAEVGGLVPGNLELNQIKRIEFWLKLHGFERTYTVPILAQIVADKLVVTNYEPITVNSKDFGLDAGVNELTKIAGLQSINYEALVNFKLVFEK